MNNDIKIPSVLSFNRCAVISDGLFFNEDHSPVSVHNVGWRGVQAQGKKQNTSNIGEGEVASLSNTSSNLKIEFMIRPLEICQGLTQISNEDKGIFKQTLEGFYDRVKSSNALITIAKLVANNILNGRWTWRNRISCESMEIVVKFDNEEIKVNAFDYSLKSFDLDNENVTKLAERLAYSWGNKENTSGIYVTANLNMGAPAIEVYPSQEFISGGDKSLYKRQNQAAFRFAKIWNALRTVDIWYPDYDAKQLGPISVEPEGANLKTQEFMRNNKTNLNFYLKNLNDIDPESNEGLFITMCLIQGGVFSGDKKG